MLEDPCTEGNTAAGALSPELTAKAGRRRGRARWEAHRVALSTFPAAAARAGSPPGYPLPRRHGRPGSRRGTRDPAAAVGSSALPGGGSAEPPRRTAAPGGASFRAARGALQALQGPGGTVACVAAGVGGGGPGAARGSCEPGPRYRLRTPTRCPQQHRAPARLLRAHHGRGAVQRPRALGEADQGAPRLARAQQKTLGAWEAPGCFPPLPILRCHCIRCPLPWAGQGRPLEMGSFPTPAPI